MSKKKEWHCCPQCDGQEGWHELGEWVDCDYCDGQGGYTIEVEEGNDAG